MSTIGLCSSKRSSFFLKFLEKPSTLSFWLRVLGHSLDLYHASAGQDPRAKREVLPHRRARWRDRSRRNRNNHPADDLELDDHGVVVTLRRQIHDLPPANRNSLVLFELGNPDRTARRQRGLVHCDP